ncbi:MAG: ribosomal RNA small subunit methyltransferase A [Deltaproteobacteria bacterium]|nr:ribosomal RNA small subunit methyltransferase A [Deltaproteobacteria bacterium]
MKRGHGKGRGRGGYGRPAAGGRDAGAAPGPAGAWPGGRPPALERFSQNFLVDPNTSRKIVDAARVGAGDAVLEIGPGHGALTTILAERVGRLRLVEIDRALVWALAERYQDEPRVEVIAADVLEVGLEALLAGAARWHVVANLPYRITSPILFALLDVAPRLAAATLMVQREVAERVVADVGTAEWGTLSVHCQRLADAAVLFDVPPSVFRPRPAVMSSVLRLQFLEAPRVSVADEAQFRRTVRAAFGHRRKTLRNSLMSGGWDASEIDAAAARLGLDLVRRGETLTLDELAALADALPIER